MLESRDMTPAGPNARTRRRAPAHGRLPLLLILIALGAVAGCGRRAPTPPTPPPPPARPLPGYEARIDSLDAVDPAVLRGRRIALDPGHGGVFRGSIGVRGLTEAAVNLEVALALRDLLVGAGAEVFLTRDTDRDFLTPADSTLRADLAERSRLANEWGPELFVSVHHNADAGGANNRNEIQTYYKLGDEGRSLDAAASLHRYLKRNLGIERHRILPGNYFVLRQSQAPAVLTEASYITNPDVEARLAQADKRRLEAEALYLGVAHFFSRRVPMVTAFDAEPPPAASDPAAATWRGPALEARVQGAFDRAELIIDGVAARPEREGDRLRWRPERPLAGGPHRARLMVALSGHGSAAERTVDFEVRRPVRRIWAEAWPGRLPAAGMAAVRARVVDAYGLAVPESLAVNLRVASGGRTRDTVLVARDGVAWGYPRVRAGGAEITVSVRGRAPSTTLRISLDRRAPAVAVFLRAEPGDSAVRPVPARGDSQPDWVTPHGFAVFALDSGGRARIPALPGWRPLALPDTAPPPAAPLRWTALLGGALHGRRILLDPEGGGLGVAADSAGPAGMGPSGTRAAIYNLDVARALGAFLAAAGAEVRLSRAGDVDASDVERVRTSEAFRADRYLRIGHRAAPPRLGYYFSSPAGRAWAERTAAELARLGLPAPPLVEDAQYVLQQTSCPALYVSLARVDDAADENRMLAPGALRAEAFALFLALAREWAPEADWPPDTIAVHDEGGRPVPGAPVVLGGALVLETDALGLVRFARTEPGPITIEVDDPRVRARNVLLDFARGAVLTGPRSR